MNDQHHCLECIGAAQILAEDHLLTALVDSATIVSTTQFEDVTNEQRQVTIEAADFLRAHWKRKMPSLGMPSF